MPTYKSYITGFLLSLGLTLAAYFAVVNHVALTLWVITGLAMVQLVVQLIFFLHLGQGEDGRWNFAVFLSTVGIVFILVIGTIWIMNHLNYNMMSDQEIIMDEGMHK